MRCSEIAIFERKNRGVGNEICKEIVEYIMDKYQLGEVNIRFNENITRSFLLNECRDVNKLYLVFADYDVHSWYLLTEEERKIFLDELCGSSLNVIVDDTFQQVIKRFTGDI